MAQQYFSDAGALTIPGAYPEITVQNSASGLSTTGIIALVGEASAGPDYTLESSLNSNIFGPDQLADVIAKYKAGDLVDAFRCAAVPANDPNIQGSPAGFILVKTNPSSQASSALIKTGGGTYGTFTDRSYGAIGNLIYYIITQSTTEVKPTTGSFTFLPPIASLDMSVRLNGGTAVAYSPTAQILPPAFVSGLAGASGTLSVTGGASRGILASVTGNVAVTVSGNVATFTYTATWALIPSVGDTFFVPLGSAFIGAASANRGSYVVTSATANTIVATKLMDGTGAPGALTAPVAVSSTAVAATTDIQAFAPVVITSTSTAIIDGCGKSLEINELSTGTDRISNCLYALNTSKVTWVSKSGAPALLVSSAESAVQVNVNRALDNTSEQFTAGGQVALQLGYNGTTCSVTISVTNSITTFATTVTGGTGANLSLNLAAFNTINDLVAYINTQTGYIAKVGTATLGQTLSIALDEGTFTAGTTWGNYTLRLKVDAVKFYQAVVNGSDTVSLTFPVGATTVAGLPAITSVNGLFLAGGTLGGTTNANYQGAVDALQACTVNFVVPLFSQDATLDIAAGSTDPTSSYTIDNINSYARTHVLAMSTIKRKRNRQAFCSKRTTFLIAEQSAANLASARCSMTFQDFKATGANGIVQYQPFMGAAIAAGMQAAGFYRAIVNKGANISGAVQAAGDFNDQNDSQVEQALLAGLLPMRKVPNGGYKWVSDQTTYTVDNNFVFNSIQAMYAADTVALTTAQRMQDAFVGQSVADVTAAVALSALEGILGDMLRLKLIAASDDAPKGYKNANIKINGPTMLVSVEIKLAGAIYFIPIQFQVSQVTQSASG